MNPKFYLFNMIYSTLKELFNSNRVLYYKKKNIMIFAPLPLSQLRAIDYITLFSKFTSFLVPKIVVLICDIKSETS